MPRGVYIRKPRNKNSMAAKIITAPLSLPIIIESDDEIESRIEERFEVLEYMTKAATIGEARSIIVSGPPGLGKSYTVETALNDWDPSNSFHTLIRGYVRAPSLYKLLYKHRHAGRVLVFDDADDVFLDDISIGLLKAACDSSDCRIIHYLTEAIMIHDETNEVLPKKFQFDGTIIFITNLDFDAMIERGSKLAPHMQALVSRSHYIDLAMKTKQDYMIRIKMIVKKGLLLDRGLDEAGQTDVIDFIQMNQDKLRELSLRIALKLASIRKTGGLNWLRIAKVTCLKN